MLLVTSDHRKIVKKVKPSSYVKKITLQKCLNRMSFRNEMFQWEKKVLYTTLYPSSHSLSLMPLSTWLIKCNNFKMHNLVSLRGSKIYNNLFYAIFLMLRFFSTHRSFCSFTFIPFVWKEGWIVLMYTSTYLVDVI